MEGTKKDSVIQKITEEIHRFEEIAEMETGEIGDWVSRLKKEHLQTCDSLLEQIDEIIREPVRIVVCGGFSTGKTSLINALTGTDLPVSICPETKVITEIRFGNQEKWYVQTARKGLRHLRDAKEAKQIITHNSNEILKIICEIPSERLRRGVVFVDTPGLYDDVSEKLDEITKNELKTADFAIFTLNPIKLMDYHELEMLDSLQESLHGNFISVVNCMNYITSLDGYYDVKERIAQFTAETGNREVGYGGYFLVESQKQSLDLDGLDEWLDRLIAQKRSVLKRETIRREVGERLQKLIGQEEELAVHVDRTKEYLDESCQKNAYMIEKEITRLKFDLESKAGNLRVSYRNNLPEQLYTEYKAISADQYVREGAGKLTKRFCANARDMDRRMKAVFSNENADFSKVKSLDERVSNVIRQSNVLPAPTGKVYQRGIFDPDRYLLGKTYTVYDDYAAAAVKSIRKNLVPRLDTELEKYMEECVSELEMKFWPLFEWNQSIMEQYVDCLQFYRKELKIIYSKTSEILEIIHWQKTE